MRYVARYFDILSVAVAIVGLTLSGCSQGGFGAFQEGVGNTPNKPPGAAFRILGQPGLQFTALVSNAVATWQIRGAVPMNVIIINNDTPVRMVATKLSAGNGILSLQLTLGFTVVDVSSTSAPYGIASLQNSMTAPGFEPPPPPASPDVRLFVRGPLTERFSGLFEDSANAFIISDRAPALILFNDPNGAVDATVTQVQNLGPFDFELLVDGAVVATVSGGPTVIIRQP